MHEYPHVYIDGAWVAPSGSGMLEVVDSTTEASSPRFPPATPPTSTARVARRRRRSPRGPSPRCRARQAPRPRGRRARGAPRQIAAVIAHEVGMPKHQALTAQVGGGISGFSGRGRARRNLRVRGHERRARRARARRRRRLHHAMELPAEPDRREGRVPLAAGCTVVLKPSEVAPVNAFVLTRSWTDRFRRGSSTSWRARPDRRGSARHTSRRRHGVVHRFHLCRRAGRRVGVES